MGRLNRICAAVAAVVVTLGLSGGTAGQGTDAPWYAFVSHAGVADPFWKIEFKGASDAAEPRALADRLARLAA